LYDTFEGFDARDVDHDNKNAFSKSKVGEVSASSRVLDPIEHIRSRMPFPEQCVFRKGYFPETAAPDSDEKFAFVSIDTDLYKPIRAGLEFFYPRLTKGGYIFVHDYNDGHWLGAKKAVSDVEEILGPLNKFPLPDWGGTLVIAKT
jgi:O-methyltransferase